MSGLPCPSTRQVADFRRYQSRLMAAGILPPRAVLDQVVLCKCGDSFQPGAVGVVRHWYGTEILYTSRCPGCCSDRTVYEAREGEGACA